MPVSKNSICFTEEAKLKMSQNRKGIPAWNKGLTKEMDERVNNYSKTLSINLKNNK